MITDEQHTAALEDIDEWHWAVWAVDEGLAIDLNHGQATAGGGDGVAFTGVGFFALAECINLGLPSGTVDDGRHGGVLLRHGYMLPKRVF